ncbi:MAG: polyprenyl synthetase family protein [Candidatus Omnitrophica bacterium]|nr:polyprenyl synthetase family protein [Candidatus Omnitrophota bacterium]
MKNKFNIDKYLRSKTNLIDNRLDVLLPKENDYPQEIHRAIRYAIFSGGKRIRPIFCLAACSAVGGRDKSAIDVACAIELVHNYSLIHDDLPAIDNDDTRRGKPTLHKKFSESTAILTGDALLSLAFGILTKDNFSKRRFRIINDIAHAVSTFGMIGGQIVDIESKNKDLELATLRYINTHKTGILIATALKAGAISGGASESQVERIFKFGEYVGFVFQIVDDILDSEGYVKIFGRQGAYLEAERLTNEAKTILKPFGKRAQILNALLDFVLKRSY